MRGELNEWGVSESALLKRDECTAAQPTPISQPFDPLLRLRTCSNPPMTERENEVDRVKVQFSIAYVV